MLVKDLIKASLRKLTVYASGELPSPEELADGLLALQSMLRRWAGKQIVVYSSTKETFTMSTGVNPVSWGSGGVFTTTRPNKILGAFVTDSSNTSHPVSVISEVEYRNITNKAIQDRPYSMFYNPSYPLGYVYLYPVPSIAESISIDSLKPFTETSSFDDVLSTLSFPPNYEEALIYNLAVRLASEFGKAITEEVSSIALSSYNDIIGLNSGNQVEPVSFSVPAGRTGSGYSINSDTYK